MDMSGLKFGKPAPDVLRRRRKRLDDAEAERCARAFVKKRDGGRCRVPNCREKAPHLHHVTYRSKSRARRWDPANLASLCVYRHGLVHAGKIQISGDANDELVITGDMSLLKFKL